MDPSNKTNLSYSIPNFSTIGKALGSSGKKSSFVSVLSYIFSPCTYLMSFSTILFPATSNKKEFSQLDRRVNTVIKDRAKTEPIKTGVHESKKSYEKASNDRPKIPTKIPPTPHSSHSLPAKTRTENNSLNVSNSNSSIPATLPPVPSNGIKVGLPNIDDKGNFGNTCWINSILKFISSGTEFDSMLTQKVSANASNAQAQFRLVVSILRSGKMPNGETVTRIPEELYKKLLKSLKELTDPHTNKSIFSQERGAMGYQIDAHDIIMALGKVLNWQPYNDNQGVRNFVNNQRKFPRQATVFDAAKDTPSDKKKSPILDDYSQPILHFNVSQDLSDSEEAINLAELTEDCDVIEARAKNEMINYKWNQHKYFTCLPQTMIFSLGRLYQPKDAEDLSNLEAIQERVRNKVFVDEDGLIVFIEYEPIYEESNIVGFTPHKQCYYRITSAISHHGGSRGGHYVCEERTAKGKMFEHSDLQITPLDDGQEFGTSGSILRLTLVKEKKIAVDLQSYLKKFEKNDSIESIPYKMQISLYKHYSEQITSQRAALQKTTSTPGQQSQIKNKLKAYQEKADILKASITSLKEAGNSSEEDVEFSSEEDAGYSSDSSSGSPP